MSNLSSRRKPSCQSFKISRKKTRDLAEIKVRWVPLQIPKYDQTRLDTTSLLQVRHTYSRNLGKIPIGGKSFTLKFTPIPHKFKFPAYANLQIELRSRIDCATQDSSAVLDLDMRVDFDYKYEVKYQIRVLIRKWDRLAEITINYPMFRYPSLPQMRTAKEELPTVMVTSHSSTCTRSPTTDPVQTTKNSGSLSACPRLTLRSSP